MNALYAKVMGCERELVDKMTDDPKSKTDTQFFMSHFTKDSGPRL